MIWKKTNSLSPFAAFGALLKLSATGTVPVFNIFSSRFSCSRAARSASNSSSSMGSVMGMEVMALPISWVSSCCSRSCSLEKEIDLGQFSSSSFLFLLFKMTRKINKRDLLTYIVVSTSSMVIFPCISFIALPAFFMATRVSWLIFADSME